MASGSASAQDSSGHAKEIVSSRTVRYLDHLHRSSVASKLLAWTCGKLPQRASNNGHRPAPIICDMFHIRCRGRGAVHDCDSAVVALTQIVTFRQWTRLS